MNNWVNYVIVTTWVMGILSIWNYPQLTNMLWAWAAGSGAGYALINILEGNK